MQRQMAYFFASNATTVVVTDPGTMVPVAQAATQSAPDLQEKSKTKQPGKQPSKPGPTGLTDPGSNPDRLNNNE
jgi:hypothetical protein